MGETLFSSNVQSDADEVREALTEAVQRFGLAFLPGLEYLEVLPLPMFVRWRFAPDNAPILEPRITLRPKDLTMRVIAV